jgi:hypothetical protein
VDAWRTHQQRAKETAIVPMCAAQLKRNGLSSARGTVYSTLRRFCSDPASAQSRSCAFTSGSNAMKLRMSLNRFSIIALCMTLCAAMAACGTFSHSDLVVGDSISVDQPEIFDNAALQTQLDLLKGQLSQLGIIDSATLTGALGNIQGTSLSQTSVSAQVLVSPPSSAPQSVVSPSSSAPATPALPAVASDAIGLFDKQIELEAQLQGYELLLGGSDFARYTRDGLVKDRVVVGFSISLDPRPNDRNKAAVVDITYFPPNSGQFPEDGACEQKSYGTAPGANGSSHLEYRYSQADSSNAAAACVEQEATPTIISILPQQRTYNVVGVTSSTAAVGAGAIIGTVNVGVSGSRTQQTQYLVADQDTVALQGSGSVRCTDEMIDLAVRSNAEHCVLGSRGIRFKWQFRPVLGETFVRAGTRHTFVQLAIPNVRRPYPYYGGITYVRTSWYPYDRRTGVVSTPQRHGDDLSRITAAVKNVFGHTFISSEVTNLETHDEGGGQLQVDLRGEYLTGANVRIGSTLFTQSSSGFLADYDSLKFIASAQTLAQNGAYLVSSDAVESGIDLTSICKFWDPQHECALRPDPAHKARIDRVRVLPISDSTSLVEVHVISEGYPEDYYHYQRTTTGDVRGDLLERTPQNQGRSVEKSALFPYLEGLPVILMIGGKAYGLSDAPFQSQESRFRGDGAMDTVFSVVVSNDALNASPEIFIRKLFGFTDLDPDPVTFVPPGNISISADTRWIALHPAKTSDNKAPNPGPAKPVKDVTLPKPPQSAANVSDQKKKANAGGIKTSGAKTVSDDPCDPKSRFCHYVVQGAEVDHMYVGTGETPPVAECEAPSVPHVAPDCAGPVTLASASDLNSNSRALTIPACARQVTLNYTIRTPRHTCLTTQLIVGLAAKSPVMPSPLLATKSANGPFLPHLSLMRNVSEVRESGGIVPFTVGIKNLKDQSATVAVTGADIVSAEDGGNNILPIQVGNSVIVAQDTSITFQVRNYDPTEGVNVTVEGKNGSASAGTVTFTNKFTIVRSAGAAGSSAPGAKSP